MNCVVCGAIVSEARVRVFERTRRQYVVYADKWEIGGVAMCGAACARIRRRERQLVALARAGDGAPHRRAGSSE